MKVCPSIQYIVHVWMDKSMRAMHMHMAQSMYPSN